MIEIIIDQLKKYYFEITIIKNNAVISEQKRVITDLQKYQDELIAEYNPKMIVKSSKVLYQKGI
jgi:hypothetical protein